MWIFIKLKLHSLIKRLNISLFEKLSKSSQLYWSIPIIVLANWLASWWEIVLYITFVYYILHKPLFLLFHSAFLIIPSNSLHVSSITFLSCILAVVTLCTFRIEDEADTAAADDDDDPAFVKRPSRTWCYLSNSWSAISNSVSKSVTSRRAKPPRP